MRRAYSIRIIAYIIKYILIKYTVIEEQSVFRIFVIVTRNIAVHGAHTRVGTLYNGKDIGLYRRVVCYRVRSETVFRSS